MFLLFVIKSYFTDSFFQTHRDLTVVGDSRSSSLGIFIETHFLVIYDTINIVPRPARSFFIVGLPFMLPVQEAFHLGCRRLLGSGRQGSSTLGWEGSHGFSVRGGGGDGAGLF